MSPVITAVGSMNNVNGSGGTTLTVTTASGNLTKVRYIAMAANSTSRTVTGVSGGGVPTWTKAASFLSNGTQVELWWGQIENTTAPTTITVTWSGSMSGIGYEYASRLFGADRVAPYWLLDVANTNAQAAVTTFTWPSLTPTRGTELYVGYSFTQNNPTAGSTSGFTYNATTFVNLTLYNATTSATAAPTATQSSGYALTIAALISAHDRSQFAMMG